MSPIYNPSHIKYIHLVHYDDLMIPGVIHNDPNVVYDEEKRDKRKEAVCLIYLQ